MKAALLRVSLIAVILGLAWWLREGFGDVTGALDAAGWSGVMILAAYHILPVALCGLSWAALQSGHPAYLFILGRWIKDGVGDLAAFVPLAGEVAGIRMMAGLGMRISEASAVMIVDVTAEAIAQVIFSLLGVSMWMVNFPNSEVTRWALMALAISIPGIIAFIALQKSTVMRFLETLPSRLAPGTWSAPDAEDGVRAAIHLLYDDRRRLALSVFWHVLAWVAGAAEAWIAMQLLGHPLDLDDILAMESVIFAIRSVAFVVPAAIGLQEGGYVIVGALLGLPTELALALSLLKRGRELVLGLPSLLAWHFVEHHGAKAKADRPRE
ncbi:hypothetical protein CU669_10200 [Paramagnetospirillum kuznetsovii]|uniref:TIGR00374 family protein n=1 Tax=Paramagnetospirillum kuznetsovii TaxID=2053833 RepID=A0A364NYC4_9PROT|nr:lysylphosphatidylglycerol synthase domain-containing protein [Paramagnetospirillum kuznetsovii]RAU22053.1 hypothetical protein CU669_10200 [Paramagnetospirillum kuznetsovii]